MENKFFVCITGSQKDTLWYKEKIGVMYLVTDEVSSDYGVIDWKFNHRGLYPLIDVRDCKKYAPSGFEKLKHFMGFEVKVKL